MRPVVPILIAVSLLTLQPSSGLAQPKPAEHDEVQVIDEAPFRAPDEKKPDLAAAAEAIIAQTNDFRADQGRSRVKPGAKLSETAREFADYMARTGRYGHTADGKQPGERATEHGYEYCVVAENIAYVFDSNGFTTDALAGKLVKGWEESPGHRRNMLDPDVVETGVAVARSERTGYYFAVQMFGRPRSMALQVKVENRSTATVSYRIGDDAFELEPRYTRTHELCRSADVTFELSAGEKAEPKTFPAKDGAHFVIVEDGGALRVMEDPASKEPSSNP